MKDVILSEIEDDEDEFRSCCGDEGELEEIVKLEMKNGDDQHDECSVRMLFKGLSVSDPESTGLRVSGIGVIIQGPDKVPVIQVQKKLEFFVEKQVADYLALMDGLSIAVQNNIKRVYAFFNSRILFDQITTNEKLKNPLLMALKQRILQHVKNLEHFVLKHVLDAQLESPLHLARVAIGMVHDATSDLRFEHCSICCEDKPTFMMIKLKCSHEFCTRCMNAYFDEKVALSEVPIRCPSPKCRYYISTAEHKSFLPVGSFIALERALLQPNARVSDKFCCPFASCAVLLDPGSDENSTDNCVMCPVCRRRFVRVKCGTSWHSSVGCDEFQVVPKEEMDAIESTHGCYDFTCWCGRESCYSCGAGYLDHQPTGALLQGVEEEEENDQITLPSTAPSPQFEEWAWDSFGSLSNMMDAYSDEERSQLALIQRFLAGGFSPRESSPSSCVDDDTSFIDNTIKDLHQLPWLERFVSVISDNNYYNEAIIQPFDF